MNHLDDLVADDWPDRSGLGSGCGDRGLPRDDRGDRTREAARVGVRPVYKRVDSCAAEVEASSNYFYSTWGEQDEARPGRVEVARGHSRLGAEPHRPGDRVRLLLRPAGAGVSKRSATKVDGRTATRRRRSPTTTRRTAFYFEPLGRGRGARDLCARAPRRRRDPVRGSNSAETCARNRVGRLAILGTPSLTPSTSPKIASASPSSATSSTSRFLHGPCRRARGGRLRRRGDRLPGCSLYGPRTS